MMSNATYMAGVIITICIAATIIITVIAVCLSRKVDELERKVHDLSLKFSNTDGRFEGLAEAISRKSALANNRIDDVERKFARTVVWVEGLTGKTIKGVDVGVA